MTTHRVPRTTSTQDHARRMLHDERLVVGDVVLADEQTAGRGRFGRRWISPQGGLYATIVCPMQPQLSLKTGLAIAGVLREAGVHATLKWPNDVLVRERKLAGVLVEERGPLALVGIGLNLEDAPLSDATCVAEHLPHPGTVDSWIGHIAESLARTLHQPFDPGAYSRLCGTLGRSVRIDHGSGVPIQGVAVAIGEDGSLVLQDAARTRRITSGACHHLSVDLPHKPAHPEGADPRERSDDGDDH